MIRKLYIANENRNPRFSFVTTSTSSLDINSNISEIVDKVEPQEKVSLEDMHKYIGKMKEVTVGVSNISRQLVDLSKERRRTSQLLLITLVDVIFRSNRLFHRSVQYVSN